MNIRVGFGYDVHRLAEGETLWLGGILIPHSKGTVAHSDGDVLIHAVCDALLGAAGLGDIGRHFPDSDPRWKDADSLSLLRQVVARLRELGWVVGNVDATVLAEAPRLAPYIAGMRERLAAALNVGTGQVSIKATTVEGLGAIGRREGISAMAVATVGPVAGEANGKQ